MQSVTQNILICIEKNFHIINDMYSEVLIAKYGGPRMNDMHTISLANFVSLPTKIIRSTTFFSKKKVIFVRLLHWPPAGQFGSQHMNSHI